MDVCLICHLEKPEHQWDPLADRYLCMYPIDAVTKPHWIPICQGCHAMILAIPNHEFYKCLLRLARRQRRKIDTRTEFRKGRKIR